MEQTITKVIDLLYLAKREGIEIILNNDKLQLKIPENKTIDKGLLDEIRTNKKSIIDYLANSNWQSKTVTKDHNKISPFNRKEIQKVPLSFSQERLWFIDQLEGSVQYHAPVVLRLRGKLHINALEKSLQLIVQRHEVLRTVYREENGNPFQHVKDDGKNWHLAIIKDLFTGNKDAGLSQYIEELIRKPFNLSNDYMLRGTLIMLNELDHVLVVTMHHIASDASSLNIIIKEVASLYSSYSKEIPVQPPPLDLQYADYAVWQRKYLQGDILDQKVAYWKEKLEGVEALQLPTDFVKPANRSTRGAAANFSVDKEVLDQLNDLSRQQGATLFITLLSAFNVLLHRYTGQQDISVGTSIANRAQQELEKLVGFFVNTLALRNNVNGEELFTDLLKQVKTTTLEAYGNQEVPFEKVVETVVKERDPSRSPLFQVMLVLHNTPPSSQLQLGELSLAVESYEANTVKFDLTFFITETENGLQGSVRYSTDLYRQETIIRMMEHFKNLLSSVAKKPRQKIGLLPMLSATEQQELLAGFNQSSVVYPKDKTIVSLFEEQVEKAPGNISVVFEEDKLTYKELNERSNQLAHYLLSKGVKAGTLIPVFIDRSTGMLVAIMGILKAGAAYVPIDVDFPSDRISYMLEDTRASIVVSSKNIAAKIHELTNSLIDIIELDQDNQELSNQSRTNLQSSPAPDDLAYVIYTSGSTGKPKGVMIEHRSLVDYVVGLNEKTHIDQCRSFALVSTIATDLGNTVIYSSLLFGGALHLFSKETVSNPAALHRYFSANKIDCLKIVPSHWKALSEEERLLLPARLLVFGGEALPAEMVEGIRLSGSSCVVVNHYGPTETTIGKLLHVVNDENKYSGTIPIGKPFSNTSVYVLSKELQPCPAGVPGQLYIAGDGIARGYLNNAALTKEKFISNPFSDTPSVMYGTGDLVKYLPGGDILFIGRVDDQVKIRGYRVELGEIESILQQSPLVSQVVVLAKEDKQGNKRLVAYIVAAEEEFDREAIQSYLKDKLPEYMVPSILVEIASLPLTANGKVDRKALPDPDASVLLSDQYTAPRNEAEEKLAAIWQEILEVDRVGIHDDFFVLGGHSLLAIRLISAIRKELAVELPISDIFDYPTIATLAGQLQTQTGKDVLPAIEVVNPRPAKIPLSFSQERLWFIHQLEGSVQYHVPSVLKLRGRLNHEALGETLQEIVNRHEVLRTVYREDEGRAYQHIQPKDDWQLSFIDGAKFKDDKHGLQQYIQQLIIAPFDLANDYMLRAYLIRLAEEDSILVITLHHIASDGWSSSILVKEVVALYKKFDQGIDPALPPLPVQYADFATWQRNLLQGEILNRKLNYWKNKLDDVAPLQMPFDFPRPAVQTSRGTSAAFRIDKELSNALQELSQQQGTTIFMTLLAAFNVLLHRYSGQKDICIGSPIAGRQQQSLEGLIGFFINMLALRSDVNGQLSFIELLRQVRTTTMEAYENQEVPFEKVVDEVVRTRDMNRNPLFQVMFVLRNIPDLPEFRIGEIKLSAESFEHTTTHFDLTLFITESADGLKGSFEYSTDLYRAETIQQMIAHFSELLKVIAKQPNQKVGELRILSINEEKHLLNDFNDTFSPYPKDKSIAGLFEEQVIRTPDSIAAIFEGQELTYQQLNERSNQLAHYLQTKGIKNGDLVPIYIERGLEMIIGLFGILKTGATFIPIDPEYPLDRVTYMLEDSGAKLVISSKQSESKLSAIPGLDIIKIDEEEISINSQPVENLPDQIASDQLAYIIYTSGSTGKPKGVMIQHHSVVNLLTSIIKEVDFKPASSFLSVTTFSFDIAYLEFFVPLVSGGKLIVVSRKVATDGYKLRDSIAHYSPSHVQGTPATWQLLLDSKWKNKEGIKILIGGEAVPETIKDQLTQSGSVFNLYGPTETTIWSAIKQLTHGEKVLIGRPIANTTIYILNEQQQLCLPKVAGEIYIGGDGLAKGYFNKEDLTNERFIKNPFSKEEGSRLYRTGDLGRWLPDGNIEYLGRVDTQVKIRGYRIELGEIETVLQQSDLVNQAVVLARENKEGSKRLVSYFVPQWTALKSKEKELYQNQVATWKEVYETEYTSVEQQHGDEEFDINIWKDSFTGEPIAEVQMGEWLQDIINIILQDQPQNVLEIGSGTGLIFYQLAGKIQKYIGTDFSAASIDKIRKRIDKGLRDYGPTELQVSAAHEVSIDTNEDIDTIVLNSVIQYFPGEDYMTDVIGNSINLLKGKGRIVIGDVRDLRLLELFKIRLNMQRLSQSVSVDELTWFAEQEVLKEEELCFSPGYFYRLVSLYKEITHVEILWKQASHTNELSKYRYNVILYVGEYKTVLEPTWQVWKSQVQKQHILDQLQNSDGVIALQDAPNPKLWDEKLLSAALKERTAKTVGELMPVIAKEDLETAEIKQIISIAEAKGYHVRLLLDEDPFKMNILFELQPAGTLVKQVYSEKVIGASTLFTNIPLFTGIASLMQKEIRQLLQQSLPGYMVPSEFIAVAKLPLTNNGKVDRKFLSEIENRGGQNKHSYVAPTTEVEGKLVDIWMEFLGVSSIGIHDNFFELGGHSLLAMRLVSAIRKTFETEIAIADVFNFPTVALLSGRIEKQSGKTMLPAIVTNQRAAKIPLSFSQERLWFIEQLEGSVQYHIPAVLRLKGKLNTLALADTFKEIVNRHEVLRTIFLEEEGVAYQQVNDKDDWELTIENGVAYKDDPAGLQQHIRQLITQPFDLSKDYMLRANLIAISDEDQILVVTLHHIASDGWSISILVKEVAAIYKAFDEGRVAELAPLPIQYADFATWQRQFLQGEILDEKLAYWENKLNGVAALQLPVDYARPAVQTTAGAKIGFNIDKELADRVQELGKQSGTTLFMTLLAAFKVLLHRYSGQQDICIGTPIAGRQQQETEELIGFFVNTLVLRSEVNGHASFARLLQQVKATTLEAYEHQEVPFEKIVANVKQRDMSRHPLFQVMFIFQNTPDVPQLQLGDVQLSPYSFEHNSSKFDLTFSVNESNSGIQVSIEYCTDLYKETTIDRMKEHFQQLLHSIVTAPSQAIDELSILTPDEETQLLTGFNKMPVPSSDTSMLALFEEQAKANPNTIAVVFEEQQLTYKELNERSNQLAHYLQSRGVNKETLVPVCIERSLDMLVAILAILKAGGAFVPVDPGFPGDRINYMLEDCGAGLIITNKQSRSKFQAKENIGVIELDTDWEEISTQSIGNLNSNISPTQLAYTIYTSGSTGKPKGVMVEHGNLVNLLANISEEIEFNRNATFLSVTTFSFDICYLELFVPLINGGKLIIVSRDTATDGFKLKEGLAAYRPTHMQATPSTWQLLQNAEWQNEEGVKILVGGEALKEDLKDYLTKKGEAWNVYGPTETTIWSTIKKLSTTEKVSIGTPIANNTIYILNPHKNLSPVGVAGEITIGGLQVARGYLNRPDLTVEKFITDPFSKAPGARMYKTGDLGRWQENGEIEYLGRMDEQVKIRGYRIELGEIETVLQQNETVKAAVVLAKDDNEGNKRLVGYIVANEAFDKEAIVAHLKTKLPEYMIPAIWVEMENLPLTPNGKIDRKALPDPDITTLLSNEYIAPRNETEQALAVIWQELLSVEKVGVHDNFFDLGGHSLLAMRVVSAVRKRLKIETPIVDIFNYPTVATLAEQVQNQPGRQPLTTIENVNPRPLKIPLSFSQERLWFIDQLEGSVQYHIPAVLRLKGKINRDALAQTLKEIVNRHEVLRTIFWQDGGQAYQQIKNKDDWQLTVVDGSGYQKDNDSLQRHINQLINKPFDLTCDYMLRAHLLIIGEEDCVLVVTIHHIAADGWSRSILVKEVVALYKAYDEGNVAGLSPLQIQYADFAIWQRNYLSGETLDKKLSYWKEKLRDVAPLQLPTDNTRPAVQSSRGSMKAFHVDKELAGQLQKLARQQDSTVFMTLLAAFKVLLHRYSAQEDICVGTPTAGRQQQETEELIGFFVNTLALRSEVRGTDAFAQLLEQVKLTTMGAYEHQDIPFEKVVGEVVKVRDLARSPVFQVMFVLLNTPDIPDLPLGEAVLTREHHKHTTAQFDLSLFITETPNGLQGAVEYSTDLYVEATIERLINNFCALLRSIVKDPHQTIGTLKIMDEAAEQQLLVEFNNTAAPYPGEETIAGLFEKQAKRTPGETAVVFEGEHTNYRQLNERSNQLARYLQNKGVVAGALIPICIERSVDMIVGVLAILKAGAAYVPIDPEYPAERIRYMLEDIGAVLVVSSNKSSSILTAQNTTIIKTDGEDQLAIRSQSIENLDTVVGADHLAYVLYTSGTTGKPKGVKMGGQGLVNLLNWQEKQFTNKNRRVLQFASLNFDVSFQEIFSTLCYGSRLYLINGDRRRDMAELVNDIRTQRLTHLFMPYIVLKNLVEHVYTLSNTSFSVEEIIVAGEQLKLSEDILNLLKKTGIRLVNQYGPTEAHVVSSYDVDSNSSLSLLPPIGKPIDNMQLYILGENMQAVPIGIPGELYIGGVQVAQGYLNLPELTNEKFVSNPFSKDPQTKLYRTGDLGRWLPGGDIEFLGRKDGQEKIRGFRVELGEIETVMLQSGKVNQAVVLAKQDSLGNKRLVSYVVPGEGFEKRDMITYLKTQLPEYMVPVVIVEMKRLPVTRNGKVDQKALPDIHGNHLLQKEYVAPQNDLQKILAEIWQKLLKVEKVGIHDNFFELGGHSLLAVKLVSAIRKTLEMDFPLNYIFIYPTISTIADNLIEKNKHSLQPKVNIKYLVPLKTGGSKIPLYIICGGGGTARRFIQFANMMDDDQPVYALQPMVDNKGVKNMGSIEEMAERFIEEILINNPDGPYALSGHCLGGITAFEMAKQLEARGKKVYMLAMFDTIIRKKEKREPASFNNFYNIPISVKKLVSRAALKIDFETYLLRKHTMKAIGYKAKSLGSLFRRMRKKANNTNDLEYAGLEIFNESSNEYVAARRNYRITPYDGEIILFYAKERYYFTDVNKNIRFKKFYINDSTKNLWSQYASSIAIFEVEGDHSNLFEPTHGNQFARLVQDQLDKHSVRSNTNV